MLTVFVAKVSPHLHHRPMSLSSYAMVGAAAFMGGATRLTLAATVMVMETSGYLQLIVPLILSVFVAKVGTHWHCRCRGQLEHCATHAHHLCGQGMTTHSLLLSWS